jgi:hypothetical protein
LNRQTPQLVVLAALGGRLVEPADQRVVVVSPKFKHGGGSLVL